MRYIFLAIFVFLAAQPLQASSCDMQSGQDMSHGQHGDMQHENEGGMDCCDPDPSNPSGGCDSMSHCGASAAAGVTIDTSPVGVAHPASSHDHLANSGHPLSCFKSPPFRPPIA